MRFVFFVLITVMALLAEPAAAHRYHVGLAQFDRDADGRLEIEHQLVTHDVEAALTARLGRVFSFDADDAEAVLKAWVETNVVLASADGKPLPLQWIGFEANQHFVHIYQEHENTPPLAGLQLHNLLLIDSFETQVNTVNLRDGAVRSALVFSKGQTRPQQIPAAKNNP